jgi:hypothetical protein
MTDAPTIQMTAPPADAGRTRPIVGIGLIVLFGLGLAVFLAPFAFPTPPPIVTRFQTTKQFSPTGDGTRETAHIAVRLSEPSTVDVEIQGLDGKPVKHLISERRPAGIVPLTWDGTNDQGQPALDGRYVVSLRATAGRKQFKLSRRVVLDRQAPPLGTLSVQSAAIAGPGDGECRVAATALDRGALGIEVQPAPGAPAIARFGPRNVTAGETSLWNWDGKRADGTATTPGLYIVRAILSDVPGNTSEQSATCWVGHLLGATVPARPKLGTRVRVALRGPGGAAIAPSTRVGLAIFRRIGNPGTASQVLGRRVGAKSSGTAGSVSIQLPRKVAAADLWIVATTTAGRALIPLRP